MAQQACSGCTQARLLQLLLLLRGRWCLCSAQAVLTQQLVQHRAAHAVMCSALCHLHSWWHRRPIWLLLMQLLKETRKVCGGQPAAARKAWLVWGGTVWV